MILLKFIKNNKMLSLSVLAAAVSMFFVPPDKAYLGYFDLKTLVLLFSMLLIVRALSGAGFFHALSHRIIHIFSDLRVSVAALTAVTLVGSMLITNDMALIAFLPLGYFVLKSAGELRYLPHTFIIQTMAANLGGMLTPFGNPQNLYLFSRYHIALPEFLRIMILPFTVSVILTAASCFIIKPEKITVPPENLSYDKKLSAVYLALFVIVVLAIFRIIPYPAALISLAVIFFTDKKAVRNADYPLIGTFCAFFVFSGNLSRIPEVTETLGVFADSNTLLTGIGLSQVISNVPAAILLSHFTENYRELLIGVNIGGVGTPIASLASLITIREYIACGGKKKPFAVLYAAFNIIYLAVLIGAVGKPPRA
jgi:Na+/H+ antiporter NhaD/arsenite permease-like protein